jgi:hypothetical protein
MYDQEIKKQVEEVIAYSQNIDVELNVDHLMSQWWDAKQKFINRFGGLIYEWPEVIEFPLDEKDRCDKVTQFINHIYMNYANEELADFIEHNQESFFDNVVTNVDGHDEIPKGMKLIKAFKYFEKNKTVLSGMQDMASRYIQENKIKGRLCFSVHPLDFLSSSENNYHWRSCHALDGEYRAGNLSYMTDETTFMVYLKGEDDEYLPDFPNTVKWNSKKWRVLLYTATNDSIIFAGRQYPFSAQQGLNTVLNIYNNLLIKDNDMYERQRSYISPYHKFIGWNNNYVTTYVDSTGPVDETRLLAGRYLVYKDKLIEMGDAVVDAPGSLQYNDLLFSTCYKKPWYSVLESTCEYFNHKDLITNPLRIGGKVMCVRCGMSQIEDSGTMMCYDCNSRYGDEDYYDDDYTTCSCCNSRVFIDDCYYVGAYDEPVCDHCFGSECFVCDHCDDAEFIADMFTVREEGQEPIHLCEHCYNSYCEEKNK